MDNVEGGDPGAKHSSHPLVREMIRREVFNISRGEMEETRGDETDSEQTQNE